MLKSIPGDTRRRRFDKEIFFLSLPAFLAVIGLFVYPIFKCRFYHPAINLAHRPEEYGEQSFFML